MKVSELSGAALDWAVAKCEGTDNCWGRSRLKPHELYRGVSYSTDWSQGGPIVEREKIAIDFDGHSWCASANDKPRANYGPTPLIAAMRCYVASKLGDDIEIPEELK